MPTITKIIDADGTPGVNCDYDTIADWVSFLGSQTNPDQLGILRGEHGYPSLSLNALTAFTTATTQDACPRLVGDPLWRTGHSLYTTSVPANAARIMGLSLSATFEAGNFRHFKLQGMQIDSLDLSLSVEGGIAGGFWIEGVSVGYFANLLMPSSALETGGSSLRVLISNSLFIGDGSSHCFAFSGAQLAGSHSIAFVNTVLAKGTTLGWTGSGTLSTHVINCVQMSKEGYGVEVTGASLSVAGNASFEPMEHADQLGSVYWLLSGEDNPGVFFGSDYYLSDYRPIATSPLIDLGSVPVVSGWSFTNLKDVAGVSRPRGAGWDIGPFEFASPVLSSGGMFLCFN